MLMVPFETVSTLKLLGVIIQSDFRWYQQVQQIFTSASRCFFILSKFKKTKVSTEDLIVIYTLYIPPLLEFGVVVQSSGITEAQTQNIERVQKKAMRIIVYPTTLSYQNLLDLFNTEPLPFRREC